MSRRYLEGLRGEWLATHQTGFFTDPYKDFLDQHGEKAEFRHIGVDNHFLYAGQGEGDMQPYAVFRAEETRFVFTLHDVENLARLTCHHKTPSVRNNMLRQLSRVIDDCGVYLPMVRRASQFQSRRALVANG